MFVALEMFFACTLFPEVVSEIKRITIEIEFLYCMSSSI